MVCIALMLQSPCFFSQGQHLSLKEQIFCRWHRLLFWWWMPNCHPRWIFEYPLLRRREAGKVGFQLGWALVDAVRSERRVSLPEPCGCENRTALFVWRGLEWNVLLNSAGPGLRCVLICICVLLCIVYKWLIFFPFRMSYGTLRCYLFIHARFFPCFFPFPSSPDLSSSEGRACLLSFCLHVFPHYKSRQHFRKISKEWGMHSRLCISMQFPPSLPQSHGAGGDDPCEMCLVRHLI